MAPIHSKVIILNKNELIISEQISPQVSGDPTVCCKKRNKRNRGFPLFENFFLFQLLPEKS